MDDFDPLALPLAGRTVLVTGTITGLTRDEARTAVTRLGGTAAASVTGKVDLLVLGEGAGHSKTAKARSLGLQVLPGDLFAALAADPDGWDRTPVGISFADYDDHHVADEPSTPVPLSDPAHWVARAVVHVPTGDADYQRQVRFSCTCGHRWLHTAPGRGMETCPRPDSPTTVPPWRATLA